jgi:hypothetical protein
MQQTPAGRGNTTTHHRTLPAATTTPALTSLESLSVAAWPINQRENVVMADWHSITPLSPPVLQNFPGLASFVWSARRRPRPRAATSSAGAFCVAIAALIGLAARLLGAHKGQEAGRQVACFRYTNNVTCCGCFLRTVLASSSNASCMACNRLQSKVTVNPD